MNAASSGASRRGAAVWMLVLVLAGALAGGVIAQLVPHSYEATSRLSVSTTPSTVLVGGVHGAAKDDQQVAASFANLATQPLALNHAIAQLRLDTTQAELARHVSAKVVPDTVVIGITVSDPSASRSARIANAISAALVAAARSVTPTDPTSRQAQSTLVQVARANAASAHTDLAAFVGLGALGGVVVVLIVLVIRSGRPKPPRGSRRSVWTPRTPGEPA